MTTSTVYGNGKKKQKLHWISLKAVAESCNKLLNILFEGLWLLTFSQVHKCPPMALEEVIVEQKYFILVSCLHIP